MSGLIAAELLYRRTSLGPAGSETRERSNEIGADGQTELPDRRFMNATPHVVDVRDRSFSRTRWFLELAQAEHRVKRSRR